jgi:hypothetical protein
LPLARAVRRRPLALALLGATLATPWLVRAPDAHASRSQFTIFQASRELRSDDAALRARTLDEIQALGVNWVRVVLYWRDIAPRAASRRVPRFDATDPTDYPAGTWTRSDRIVDEARRRGINLLVTISGPVPKWATRHRRGYVNRPSPVRFRRFVTAVGRRYGAAVRLWSVWNEPNHPGFLGPQYTGRGSRRRPASPRIYRRLFRAARAGLRRSGNARDRVLMGETAPRGNSNVVGPLALLRGALCLDRGYRRRGRCKRLDVDGWAHHPYTTSAGPWFVSPRRDDVTIGTLSRLRRALDLAGRARVVRRAVPIYLTEFGVQSHPDRLSGVSLTKQAEYRAIAERIALRNPRVRAFSQYQMRDDLPRPGSRLVRYSGFESGLRRSGGRAKPAYRGFRLPLVAVPTRGHRARLWGLVRPATAATVVEIQARARAARRWRTIRSARTNRAGYWRATVRHRRGASYRVRWTGPDGRTHSGARTRAYRW